MLKFLHIENIAVIEKTDIDFTDGFNVLTGETGAGKSIIIDSINTVLGERTSKDIIRAGCDTAEVSAVFGDISDKCMAELAAEGFEPDGDGNLIVTRRLSVSGKGFVKINGKPISTGLLRDISRNLIDIHGQHDNQALMDPERHIDYIDMLGGNSGLLEDYLSEFRRLNSIRKELKSLMISEDEKARRTDILKYQIRELEGADIKPGELAELKQKLGIAENLEATLKTLSETDGMLNGGEDFFGALSLLGQASRKLSALGNPSFDACVSNLNDAVSYAKDAAAFVSDLLNDDRFREINLDAINQRLDSLSRLMLKYGNSEEEMLSFLGSAKSELESIELSEERISELQDQLDAATDRLIHKAELLTASRQKTADWFEKAVAEVLSLLNMPSVKFKVLLCQGKYTKIGCDTAEFLISANQGETPKPIRKIASGGELSRIMLAIKSVLLDKDSVGTMIFDEIDSGISGYTADKVALQLKKVASCRQVICVTHLAQIAAYADNHLLILKNELGDRTYTEVSSLDREGRIKEIARIMSGTEITDNLYNSAKELIDRSFKNENL